MPGNVAGAFTKGRMPSLLNTVTLTWDLTDLVQTGLDCEIDITPTAVLSDSADHRTIPEVAHRVRFRDGSGQLAGIIACDNPQITPPGWGYTITVTSLADGRTLIGPYNVRINYADGATQDLSALPEVFDAIAMQQYLPVPSGVAAAGTVPTATGNGTATHWATPGSGAFLPLSDLPLPISDGGTGRTTRQDALDALAGNQAAGSFLRSDGTHVNLGPIQAADVPPLPYDPTGAAVAARSAAEAASLPIAGGAMQGFLAPANPGALTFGPTIQVDASEGNDFPLTLTASTGTIAVPTNLEPWQIIRYHLTQGPGGTFTVAWAAGYNFGADTPPTLSQPAGAVDKIAFQYDPYLGQMCYLGAKLGF